MDEQDVEAQAREMGWTPREEFKGDPERWLDAEAYVERGQFILPILKANNAKLLNELTGLRSQNQELQEAIKALKEEGEETTRAAVKRAIERLKQEKASALKENDTEQVVEIDEAIAELKKKQEGLAKPGAKSSPADGSGEWAKQPWARALIERPENDWFGVDPVKGGYAMGVGYKLKAEGFSGEALLRKMLAETNEHFGGSAGRKEGKMEDSRGGSDSRREAATGKKSWASLPADAKAACDRFSKILVGPGKTYKTVDEHRAAYAKRYFAGEEEAA